MKDNNLINAIRNLPELKAPEVWLGVEKSLNSGNNNKSFWFGFSLMTFIGLLVYMLNLVINVPEKITPMHKDIANTSAENVVIVEYNKPEITNEDVKQIVSQKRNSVSDPIQNISKYSNIKVLETGQKLGVNTPELFSEFHLPFFKKVVVYKDAGENLVNNPSFEDYTRCPKGIVGDYERKLIPMWEVPSKGTPDYFNSCSKGEAGVPNNFGGKAWAHSGKGYCGIILRQNFTKDNRITGEKNSIYREYIQTELKSELVNGKKYRVQFWICNSSKSRFAVDAVGACITSEKVRVNHREVMELVPQIENPTSKFISNRDYWIAVEGIYEAKGGEKFITIGNFYNNFSTNYIMIDGNSDFNYAYYYIDDVSVVEVSASYDLVEEVSVPSKLENNFAMSEF